MSQTWKAFVISQTDNTYTIISERDKKYHTLSLPIQQGNIRLPDESIVQVQELIFNPAKLWSACKEYDYNLRRKRNQYQRRQQNKPVEQETTINPFA